MNPTLHESRGVKRRPFRKLAASVAALAVVATGVIVATAPAEAATGGTGWGTFGSSATAYKGTFKQGGAFLICGEAGKNYPTDTLTNAGLKNLAWVKANLSDKWGAHPNITAKQLAGINHAMATYGSTTDKNTAAALEYAIRSVLYPQDADIDFLDNHQGSMNAAINFDLYSTAGPANVADIQSQAASIISLINSTPVGTGSTGSGTLDFNVNVADNYKGTVTMDGTAGSTGTITLTNGVFVSTGTKTLTGAKEGVAYAITGVVPAVGAAADQAGDPYTDGGTYKIWGTGSFKAPGTSGYAANIRVWTSSAGNQNSLSVGGKATNKAFTVAGEDPTSRGVQFLPVIATKATTFVQPGANFSDAVNFSTVADDNGTNNDWYQSASGNYAPVTAKGTIYGPFQSQPAQSDTVPAGAPVAGTATVTSSLADGPTVSYTATSDSTASAGGYYTWVWTIDWADQTTGVQNLVPGPSTAYPDEQPYHFADKFGQVAETHIVPSDISGVSKVTKSAIALSDTSEDSIAMSAKGFWNQVGGANIPVVVRDTAYFVPGAAAVKEQSASDPLPAGTVKLESTTQTVTGPGDYTFKSKVPDAGIGHVTWVSQVLTADQDPAYAQMVQPWSDDFGVPSETQDLLQPTVSTQAQAQAYVGTSVTDTAKVGGTLPVEGADLHFELYKAEKDANGNWVCDASHLLWTSPSQLVTKNGEYTSPKGPGQVAGTYHWVEVLDSTAGNEIHRGICGAEGETTTVIPPTVSTKAQAGSKLGDTVKDTAIIAGNLPDRGANLTFDAYKVPMVKNAAGTWVVDAPKAGQPVLDASGNPVLDANGKAEVTTAPKAGDLSWVCTADNLAFHEDKGQTVTKAGDYDSTAFTPKEYAKYLWVETLTWNKPVLDVNGKPVLDANGVAKTEPVIEHKGTCGLLNETSFVVDVTTKAHVSDGSGTAAFGDQLWDTAELTGYVPEGGSVEFNVYQTPKGQAPVCTTKDLMTTLKSADSKALTGGLYTKDAPLEVVSAKMKNTVNYDSDVYFVEVTKDSSGRVVSQGKCGDSDETVAANASAALLSRTGGVITGPLLGGAGVILILGLGALLIIRRRNRVGKAAE